MPAKITGYMVSQDIRNTYARYIYIHIYEKSAIRLTSVGEEFLCRARKR